MSALPPDSQRIVLNHYEPEASKAAGCPMFSDTTGSGHQYEVMGLEEFAHRRGFAVEPFEYLDLFEQFGGVLDSPHPEVLARSVPVVQIETRNPHFHENKGEDHVQGMRTQALNVLYHSPVAPASLREAIRDFMVTEGALAPEEEPPRERIYPPVGSMALDLLFDTLTAEAASFRQIERYRPGAVPLTA